MNWQDISFSPAELARYNRHIIIPDFGMEAQQKLKAARVLVVGSGGLGSPLLLYLAAAGVGHIGLVDFDVVDDSNLQRQVLFDAQSVGRPKVEAARDRLRGLNPHIALEVYNTQLTSANALELVRQYDVVADGTDNFPTRYLVNDACVLAGKPNVYASIFQFEGQVSVFNQALPDGTRGPNYRDLFAEPPPPGLVPSCAEGGVLGVLPGIIGSLQALEVIKVITGVGETLSGRLFTFDALGFTSRTLRVRKDPANPISGDKPTITALIDYEAFCGLAPPPKPAAEAKDGAFNPARVREISVQDLKAMRDRGDDFQLIDVREPHEVQIAQIGGELIPLGTILFEADRIARDKPVVIHCKSGARSGRAVAALQAQHGFTNLYNLAGGVLAWADQIDRTMQKY